MDLCVGAAGTTAENAESLELIARTSMLNDALEKWGDRVFTDARVRKALAQLAAQPSDTFLNELSRLLGKPEIRATKLCQSLARVMDAESLEVPQPSDGTAGTHKPKPPTGGPPGGGKGYALDHRLHGTLQRPPSIASSSSTSLARAGCGREPSDPQAVCRLLCRGRRASSRSKSRASGFSSI